MQKKIIVIIWWPEFAVRSIVANWKDPLGFLGIWNLEKNHHQSFQVREADQMSNHYHRRIIRWFTLAVATNNCSVKVKP